jgi:hypothetical protein
MVRPAPSRGARVIGMMKPTALLAMFPDAQALKDVAEEVERQTVRMIEEAR